MIQVRCPECGFLQTLSEERFLTLPSNFLTCPHCHARVPKEWQPVDSENIPEEARHKMLAFSRRILNGGDVNRDMVYALESLVRHYGTLEDSAKALGIGYARLGETKKAEEFLLAAQHDSPNDREILSSFLQVRLEEQDFDEAIAVGQALIEASAGAVHDDDIARLALALVGVDRRSEARALISSYPGLDQRNPLVREARRQVNRAGKPGIRSILGRWASLNRMFRGSTEETFPQSAHATRVLEASPIQREPVDPSFSQPCKSDQAALPGAGGRNRNRFQAIADYWIYASGDAIPQWEAIRGRMAAEESKADGKPSAAESLQSLLDKKALSVEYIYRKQSPALFEYPEDLIPRNSRGLSDNDRQIIRDARMIARVRLSTSRQTGLDHLRLVVQVTEAIREETGGVVQDAISHVLWGTDAWKRVADGRTTDLVSAHVHFEALEESGSVWIHTHGMAKFGIPDVEMEGVPDEFASTGMRLLTMMARSLIRALEIGTLSLQAKFHLEGTPVLFKLRRYPSDDEGHFPAGSLKVFPYVADYDPASPATMRHVLRMLARKPSREARPEGPDLRRTRTPHTATPEAQTTLLRQKLLEAHSRARTDLPVFKKLFQEWGMSPEQVFAVKVGFPLGDGAFEWMWVSLDAWRGGTIVGFLENGPTARKDLHKGCRVQVSEGEVFDWAIVRDGAIVKGAYTERVMPREGPPAAASGKDPAQLLIAGSP
ncbi:MAG: DUF2314 domain-containing protein [Desulfomonile sp.]|nr:DUF2314 domain-containing protein [Desulfomonile sp.]